MYVYVCACECGSVLSIYTLYALSIARCFLYGVHVRRYGSPIDIKKVDKQLTHAMHVKDRHVNDTFIDKLTKWYQ